MSADPFQPAVRGAQKARILLAGPSKSGKTVSALLIARGLAGEGKVAVIDTEGGRSRLEANREGLATKEQPSGFAVIEMKEPFAPSRVEGAIATAQAHGYSVVVIDGISPFWEGPGGVMEIADNHQVSGNKFAGWAKASPEHQKLLAAITHSPIHVICTCRSKQEYVQERDERTGKTVIRKVGLKPVQRDGIEYEFDVAGMLTAEHAAAFEARGPFEGVVVDYPGIGFGQQLRDWLGSGASPAPPETPISDPFSGPPTTGEGATPAPPLGGSQEPPEPAPADPFAPTPEPAPLPPAPGNGAITDEQTARLLSIAGELARLDPSKGDQTARVNAMNDYAHKTYGKFVPELSDEDAQRLIELGEETVLALQERG